MKTAIAQINCSVGDIPANCAKISLYAGKAADIGCDTVIFPEMTDTGYRMPEIKEKASPWPGIPYDVCREAAIKNKIYLISGLSERDGTKIYNSTAIFSPEGKLLGRYRKTHLFPAEPINEPECFGRGDSLTIMPINGLLWGFTICYDIRFPEIFRALALQGACVLVNCSAWPASRSLHWETLSKARAIENQAYFLGANRIGKDGKVPFCGRSCIIEPYGNYAALASEDREELIVSEIDTEKIESFRSKVPVFQSRRGDIYGNLKTKPGKAQEEK